MKTKYFFAAEQEACIEAAEEYFQVGRDDLCLRFMTAPEEREQALLAILPGAGGLDALENMDSFFLLNYTEKGVKLEIYPSHGRGHKKPWDEITAYLSRKRLTGLSQAAVSMLQKQGWGETIIAPPQQERILDEETVVGVGSGDNKAVVRILPADQGGRQLDEDTLRAGLNSAGVTHGVDEDALRHVLREKALYKDYTVAQSIEPQPGEHGYLTYHFKREFSGRPKEDEYGRVDYRSLDLFENVKEGQLLVSRTLAEPGISGYTVKGRVLPAAPVKNVNLPSGKNTYMNEEKTALYAAVSGMVVQAGNTVSVSNIYTVNGDANMRVGNIDFDGSVIITGNVIPGLTIKASGNIEVGGVVECSTLIAGGNIVLKHGAQGMNKGVLQAEGNIIANYIERTTVVAGGNISANIIAHSMVEAGDSIFLSGKNGSLVGGLTRVSNVLSAHFVGTATETPTAVEVGLVPHKRARIIFLRQELKRLETEIEKLETILSYMERNPSTDIKMMSMKFSAGQSLANNNYLLSSYTEELEQLLEESANAIHGKVHISDTIFPGARVTIAAEIYQVNNISTHCTFRMADGVVTFGMYEGQ